MDIGLIAPINYLNSTKNNKLRFCYTCFLDSPIYRNYFSTNPTSSITILDGSPDLPRKGFWSGTLITALEIIKPDFIVLPSMDFSSIKTIELARRFVHSYRSYLPKTIGMLQGVELESLARCYNAIKDISNVIGLSSSLEKIARREEIIRDLKITKPIIYIEVYSNPYEEIPPKNSMGIVTSFPFRLAADLRELQEFKPTPPPLDFHMYKGELIDELVVSNISKYIEAVNNP